MSVQKRSALVWWSAVGVVVLALSATGFSRSFAPDSTDIHLQTTTAPAYAEVTAVRLSEIVPAQPGLPDVEVRLIAIEGAILLPSEHVR